jgi:hypothetical protein
MAQVGPTQYPGGPPALAIRLTTQERRQLLRHLIFRFWPAVIVFGALAAIFISLNTRPNSYGLLGVISIGLGLLALFAPFIRVWNEAMTVHYLDDRWLALYLGPRRRSVDLTAVRRVRIRRWFRYWSFGNRLSWCYLPTSAIEVESVKAALRRALSEADSQHSVRMSREARDALALPPAGQGPGIRPFVPTPILQRPPLNGWPEVRGGGLFRLRS